MNKYTEETIRTSAEYITGRGFWQAGDLYFADGPSGLRIQSGGGDGMALKDSLPATSFPAHSALACSFDRSLVYGVGRRIAEEAAAHGVDILLAPAVNIKRNPYNGRNFEYFSEDAFLTGELGAAYVEGVQSTGVGACVKHFAANNRECARSASDSVISERTLFELYLAAFAHIVKTSAPAAVMTSYNKINGVYCNENRELIADVLRGGWGFSGLVVSDWGGTYDRVKSVKAGADLEMPACPISTEILVEAFENGEISGDEIEACASRLRTASARPKPQKIQYDAGEHAEFAYAAACESAVLLKNDGVLPLKRGSRVAVFGQAAVDAPIQGDGSSHVHADGETGILSALKSNFTVTGFCGGYKAAGRRARRLIDGSDAVIVCLAMYEGDTEGRDKSTLALPEEQIRLVRSLGNCGRKVICLLACGGATDTSWDVSCDALLYLGLSGQGAARAAADILSGAAAPSGRLAESFFNRAEELPSTEHFNRADYYTVYAEGLAVGYRYYLSANVPAKYPFGYGLSYTEFSYSEPRADLRGVIFTVTNRGLRDGADVPQVYIGFPQGAHEISPRLAGFERVFLRAGETKTVFIPFTEVTFAIYDVRARRNTVVSGKYTVYISKNSQCTVHSAEISIEGECAGVPADLPPVNAPAEPKLNYTTRGRVVAELLTPFGELKNSKSAFTRLFVRCALYAMRNKPMQQGTLLHSPVKAIAQFAAFDAKRTEGFIKILNGHIIKGLSLFLKGHSVKASKKRKYRNMRDIKGKL